MLERVKLNTENLNRLVESLKSFAAEHRTSGRGRYVLFGDKLIHEGYLARDPGLAMRILNRHRAVNRIELPFVADRIEVQTNARIFGLKGRGGRPSTVKILMRSSGGLLADRRIGNSFFADIRARRMAAPILARTGHVFAPRILDYDRKHGRWMVEEFVVGKEVQPTDLLRIARLVDGSAVYGGMARLKPGSRFKKIRPVAEHVASIDPDFPLPPDDALWPSALLHRDLRTNLLSTPDGRLCLLDWELARVGPVAFELASLYFLVPDLKPILIDWLRRLDPDGRAVQPEIQLGLSLMRFDRNILLNRAALMTKAMEFAGYDHVQAAAHIERERANLHALLKSLRTP